MAKSMLRQTLHGLVYMHSNGVGHGDLQPGNLLFPIKDLRTVDEKLFVQQYVSLPTEDKDKGKWRKRGISKVSKEEDDVSNPHLP